jgi:hypothetical protein
MKLAAFAKWVLQEGPFEGHDLDGADCQRKAVECGLLTETTYDPETHGESDYCEPGDPWYVFSDAFRARLRDEHGGES